MREPIILRCQCQPECQLWMCLDDRDSSNLGDHTSRIVHPAHADRADRLLDARRGYAIIRRSKLPA